MITRVSFFSIANKHFQKQFCYIIPSCFGCYKPNVFSYFSIVFPKTALFIKLKKCFSKPVFVFFFLALDLYKCMVLAKLFYLI